VHTESLGNWTALQVLNNERKEENKMKYVVAWMLGVPGIVVLIWFLMSHH